MRKKYILLKDLPGIKTGAIFEERCDGGDQDFVCINIDKFGKYPEKQTTVNTYYRRAIMEEPEWFEEVDLLYLTKKQIEKIKKFLKF